LLALLTKFWKLIPIQRLQNQWNRAWHVNDAIFESTTHLHKGAKILNLQKNKGQVRIGHNTHMRGELLVFAHGGEICIGNYCYVGEGTRIWSAKNISIGNYVLIAHGVNIHDNISHPIEAGLRRTHTEQIIHHGHPKKDIDLKEKEVMIMDDAWIGFNATVLRGVTIGRGAVIGACSVVTENVPDYAIVVGSPARIIGYANKQG
jgi:acetyltransferase-like isoleucine patch superfamily enzyme